MDAKTAGCLDTETAPWTGDDFTVHSQAVRPSKQTLDPEILPHQNLVPIAIAAISSLVVEPICIFFTIDSSSQLLKEIALVHSTFTWYSVQVQLGCLLQRVIYLVSGSRASFPLSTFIW
jgi:hypothetical protein